MFKSPLSFDGRIRRTEFGLTLLILVIPVTLLNELNKSQDLGLINLIYIPLQWLLWAQGAKRCHDIAKSGWWQLIPFYVFWLIFQEGEYGTNGYGENPKGIQSQPNSTKINNIPQNNSQFGYNGGHNSSSQSQPKSTPSNQTPTNGGYSKGDLYN